MEENKNAGSVSFQIDFRAFWRMCLKEWKWFAIIIFVFAAYGAYSYFKSPQKAQVTASVMLPTSSGSTNMVLDIAKNFSLGDMFGGSSSTENESMVLGSYDQYLRTTHKLGLNVGYSYKGKLNWKDVHLNPPIKIDFAQSIADTLQITHYFNLSRNDDGTYDVEAEIGKAEYEFEGQHVPFTLHLPTGDFTISTTEYMKNFKKNSKFGIVVASYSNAAQGLAKSVEVSIPSKKADFLALSYVTSEPEYGILLLNTIIESYNDIADSQKDQRNNRTLLMVNKRLASLSKELAASEQEIETFKKQNNLTDIEADAKLLIEQAGTYENSLFIAQTENAIIRSTRDFINDPANRYQLIPSLAQSVNVGNSSAGNTAANSAIDEYNKLVLERMKMMTSAKNNNSTLKLIDEQLDALLANIKESVERAYVSSNIALKDIKSKAGDTKSTIGSYPVLEREFLGMKRNQLVQEQLYLFLLKQREEALISLTNTAQSCVTIDQPHVLSVPVGMSPFMRLFIFSFIGLLVAAALVFFLRYIKIGFFTIAGLRNKADVPVIGAVSGDPAAMDVTVTPETARTRADLIFTLEQIKGKRVLVTAPAPGQGNSHAALALAASLAEIGKRTVIVDADYRTDAFAAATPSLADYVIGNASLDGIIKSNYMGIDSLDGIAAGEAATPGRVLSSDRMTELVDTLSSRYDYIIIAASEVGTYSETYALARVADLTLMTLRTLAASPADVKCINNLAAEGRFPNIAIIVTEK